LTQTEPRSSSSPNVSPRAPELLAPAGDRLCAVAAVENGADAIYFGLYTHNARARAANFGLDELPDLMALLHARGVRGYVTLNTLVFPGELAGIEQIIWRVAEAGVDAAIVQDLGLARLIRAITPDLEIHASTQMSVTSAEGAKLARELGCSRVILARELSLKEIARVREACDLPVEVFVHGALCVAYSGQCLTSEALGGRSANRGECAQACRMPYEIVCDGERVDLDRVKYLLSPQDLAAFDLVPKLVELGVASLKIEGRLKAPEYVANVTRNYRRAIDEASKGKAANFSADEVRAMEMTFSRGFSHGFLDGNNHKVLVRGDYAKKRGVFLGRVTALTRGKVRLDLAAPVRPGDGVVFDGDEATGVPEQGGRVYEVRALGKTSGGTPSAGPVDLAFGHRDIDTRRLVVGQRVWKTDDPELTRKLRATFEGPPRRLVALDLEVRARVGEPLRLRARTETGLEAEAIAEVPLKPAARHPATVEAIREQVERLGGTIYKLGRLECEIEGDPLVPHSLLNALRRDLVERLDRAARLVAPRTIAAGSVLPALRESLVSDASIRSGEGHRSGGTGGSSTSAEEGLPNAMVDEPPVPPDRAQVVPSNTDLIALCRTTSQAEAAARSGLRTIYLDYQDPRRYREGVHAVRELARESRVYVATPRIEKPGEAPLFRLVAKQGANGLLVRNAGGLAFCAAQGLSFVADFSLNAANELTVAYLRARGAERVTASYDLSAEQLLDLLKAVPPGWLEVVVHQHMPMFHMEHCVFCAFLSPGTDHTNCGRPCDSHDVKLRDRVGMEHPLKADVGCRNTLFNAVPQTAAEYLPRLIEAGARSLRVEFLDDSAETVAKVIGLYQEAIAGRREGRGLWKDLRATNQYGVTRGQLAIVD
jgi:putative protease